MPSKIDHDWFLPILLFAVPIIFLGYFAFCLWKGEINVRGAATYRRTENPSMFWFCAGTLLFAGVIWMALDINELFSN